MIGSWVAVYSSVNVTDKDHPDVFMMRNATVRDVMLVLFKFILMAYIGLDSGRSCWK